MKVHIKVKKKHIVNGVPCNAYSCPIAQAIGEVFPESVPIVYAQLRSRLTIDDKYVGFYLPDEAKTFISAFDAGNPVEPFSFDADIVL